MHTLKDMAKCLNRPTVQIGAWQKRFALPVYAGAGYPEAYLAFLRRLAALRSLNISEDALSTLWEIEKKLLVLLHADSTGSSTWFLDSCGPTSHSERRLLLSNHDMGISLDARTLQLGLNFTATPAELFAGPEMGEDALRVLGEYMKKHDHMREAVKEELPHLRDTVRWAGKWSSKEME